MNFLTIKEKNNHLFVKDWNDSLKRYFYLYLNNDVYFVCMYLLI